MFRRILSSNFIKSFLAAAILFLALSGSFEKPAAYLKQKISGVCQAVAAIFNGDASADISLPETSAKTKSGYITKSDIMGSLDMEKGKEAVRDTAESLFAGYLDFCEMVYENCPPIDVVFDGMEDGSGNTYDAGTDADVQTDTAGESTEEAGSSE